MRFDEREWVNDIVAGAVTGMIGGAVLATLVPEPPLREAIVSGGVVGFVTGILMLPLKWLIDRRPGPADSTASDAEEDEHET